MGFIVLFLLVVGGIFALLKAAGYEVRMDGAGTPRTGDMFAPDDPDYYVMGPGSADW